MLNLKMYELTNGKTIVCQEADLDNVTNTCVFRKPMQVMMQPTQEGIRLGLIPWMFHDVNVYENHIIAVSDPIPQVETQYLEMTTGIQLAK